MFCRTRFFCLYHPESTPDYSTESPFISQVAFSPDGKRLTWIAESTGEGSIVIWDLDKRRQQLIIGPRDSEPDRAAVSTYTSLALSADGRIVATGTRSTPGPDPRVILWDSETGRSKQILRGHSDTIFAVAFSPDSKILASASLDRTVKLWMSRPPVLGQP